MDEFDLCDGYRAGFFEIRSDESGKPIGVASIAATEAPVPMRDYSRKGAPVIPEVLLMSGAQFPERVKFLDTHDTSSVKSTLGSFTNLRVENGQLVGNPEVSDAEPGVKKKIEEKHIDGLSVGYRIQGKKYVDEGRTEQIDGRSFTGPVNVVTKWTVREVSAVPFGADEFAKIRAAIIDKESTNQSKEFMEEIVETPVAPVTEERKAEETPVVTQKEIDVEAVVARQLAERDSKRADVNKSIRSEAERLKLNPAQFESCESLVDAQRKMLDVLASNQKEMFPIFFGASQRDKTTAAIEVGLAARCMDKKAFEHSYPKENLPAGYQDFKRSRLMDVAKSCAELDGVDTRSMNDTDLAQYSMGYRSHGMALNTTGSFPSLMLNVLNKELLTGYQLSRTTYQTVGRIGPSAKDFKKVYRMRLAETPFLDVWTDDSHPNEVKGADKNENGGVEARSNVYSISYQTLINDDLSSLSRIPQQLGASAAATVNYVFWKKVIDNVTMNDTYSIFDNTHHANDITSGNVPSTSQLNSMRSKMMTQKGITGTVLIAAEPKYLVGPAALRTNIVQLCESEYDSSASQFMTKNVNRDLTAVVEPMLDVYGDTHTYYLFADNTTLTSLEVVFLEGQEAPVIRNWLEPGVWAQKIQVIQSFTILPVDFQAMVRNAGQ